MIDGLKLTLTGEELRTLLAEGAARHRACASSWSHEAARTPEDQTEDAPLFPTHMCENEASRQTWLADVLEFLEEHVEPAEIYRLGEADLAFGELLPVKPEWMEQDDYEERSRVAFELSRIARRVCLSPEIIQITNPASS
jgi:hypothetical protein